MENERKTSLFGGCLKMQTGKWLTNKLISKPLNRNLDENK